MRRVQCTMLFVTVALFACSGSAFACVCVGESRKLSKDEVKAAMVKEFNDAAMVFAAEVLTIDTFQVKFRTITIWKGDAFLQLTMSTGAKKIGEGYVRVSSCDYTFKVGEKYLVYALTADDYELVARSCTRTRLLADGQPDIPELDVLNPRAYHAPTPEVTQFGRFLLGRNLTTCSWRERRNGRTGRGAHGSLGRSWFFPGWDVSHESAA